MEKEIFKWRYSFNGEEFKIFPEEPCETPHILHKLYALNDYSIDSLVNHYVYATHPFQFNDIFDCNEELLDFDSDEVIRAFIKDTIPGEELNRLLTQKPSGFKQFVQRNFREIIYRKIGVFSMTSDPNNILMWSYYGNHAGFCIEFDIREFPFRYFGPFPINYQPEIEALSVSKIGIQIGTLVQCNIKDAIWKHENEWRLLISAPAGEDMITNHFEILRKMGGHDRKFPYPLSAIKSITLANRFFMPDELKDITKIELEINLKSYTDQKAMVLDFIVNNKIKTLIGIRIGLTTIGYAKVAIEKVEKYKYKIFLI